MNPEQTEGELSDAIQGNILCGFRFRFARLAFFEVVDPVRARSWIGGLEITDGSAWKDPAAHPIATTLAFTASGFAALEVREEVLGHFPVSFRDGMKTRLGELGDPLDPVGWDPVFSDPSRIHILLSLYADDEAELGSRLHALEDVASVRCLHVQKTETWSDREHFGFRDGISQPVRRSGADQWKSDLPIGEFLVFPEAWSDRTRVEDDPDMRLAKLGTFLVYRKLEQDVFAFRDFVQRWFPIDPDHMAARVMGRWPNGAPVRNEALPEDERDQPNNENAFDFSDDETGAHCPIGAHIRRANPRNSLAIPTQKHRMIRRGRTFGPPAPPITSYKDPVDESDGKSRGLIFLALVGDIPRQFEFVQRSWINAEGFNGLDGSDPVAASIAKGNFRLASGRALPVWQFTTLRGGEYFFVPGMQAILRLAANEFG